MFSSKEIIIPLGMSNVVQSNSDMSSNILNLCRGFSSRLFSLIKDKVHNVLSQKRREAIRKIMKARKIEN